MANKLKINKAFVKSFVVWFLIAVFIIDVWSGLVSLHKKQKMQQKLDTLVTVYGINKNNPVVQGKILSQINNLEFQGDAIKPLSSKADWWSSVSSGVEAMGCSLMADGIAHTMMVSDFGGDADFGISGTSQFEELYAGQMGWFLDAGCPDTLGWAY